MNGSLHKRTGDHKIQMNETIFIFVNKSNIRQLENLVHSSFNFQDG